MNNIDEKLLRNAQWRKSLSISYFNSLNSAIALCVGMNVHEEATFKRIEEIRDLFLENHKNYYANVIANVGVNYRADESIAKLKETKTVDELKEVWMSFSADERADGEIKKVVSELKKKYEKN